VTAAIRLSDVHKRFGRRDVLAGVSLDVAPGAKLGLIGPAASGKSVLLKLVAGLDAPDRGSIEVLGEQIVGRSEASLGELRRRIGMLFQNYALFDFLTVAGNVAFPLEQRGGHTREQIDARVADAEIVIYDEPSAGLDPVTTQKIYDLLADDHARTHATVVAVSSDVGALVKFVDEIAFLYNGHIIYRCAAATIADAPDPLVRQFVRGELDGPLDDTRRARA